MTQQKIIDLAEYDSPNALEWAAAYYELSAADDTYIYASFRVGWEQEKSYGDYAQTAYRAQQDSWVRLLDLDPDWLTHHDR